MIVPPCLQRPITAPWDATLRPNTTFLSLTEGLAAEKNTLNEPSQVTILPFF